jgi:aminotransferase
LKQAVARHLERTKGIIVDPEAELFISCGAMEALAAGLATIIERGDEVLLPSPNYSSHIEQILFAEGIPVFVPLIEEEGWRLDIRRFKQAVTKKTKAVLICHPMNPTGTVFSKEELTALAEIAIERNLLVIADEAYDFLVYDGLPSFSLSSIPELKKNLISCHSFSKAYCMTGWRVGYMHAPSRLIDQVLKVHDAFAICAPTVSQYAALAALQATNGVNGEGDKFIRHLISSLDSRRKVTCRSLDRLSHILDYQRPNGAYYVFPKILLDGVGSVEMAIKLLYEAKVVTVPGNGFGPTGKGHLRLSFGATEDEIIEAFERIESWAERYR